MSEPISQTTNGDAPLSAAINPNTAELSDLHIDAEKGEEPVGRTVTINRPRTEVYQFWRDFRNLPRFMHNLRSISVMDSVSSHWVAAAPAGQTVEWDAIVTEDEPNRLIAWTSAKDASLPNSGRVEFRDAQAGRGTEVTATIFYDPPPGALGKLVANLFRRDPKVQTRWDLRRFKQLMETGEISPARAPDAAPRS
jgi:uncharacterized membrane protein